MKISSLYISLLVIVAVTLAYCPSWSSLKKAVIHNIPRQEKPHTDGDADLKEFSRILAETVKVTDDRSLSSADKKERLDRLSLQARALDQKEKQRDDAAK